MRVLVLLAVLALSCGDGPTVVLEPASPARPDSERGALVRVTVVGADGVAARALGDREFRQAVEGPGGAVAAVAPDGGLWVSDDRGARLVARGALPGLAFSPDGERLAWVRGPGPRTSVVVTDLPTGATRTIAEGNRPSFSPDARFVAFVSGRTGVPSVWIAPAGGGPARQATNVGLRRTPGRAPEGFLAPPRGPDGPRWIDGPRGPDGPRWIDDRVEGESP